MAPKESIENCLSKDRLLSIANELEIPVPRIYNYEEIKKYRYDISNFCGKFVVKPSLELSNKKVIYKK